MGVREIGRRLIDGVWVTGVAEEASPNGGSQPLRIVKATFGFADFEDQGGDLGRSPLAFTLAEDEQLLFAAVRVTEDFDDSGTTTFYTSSAAAGPFGALVGVSDTTGPGASVAADGLVNLFFPTTRANSWDSSTPQVVAPVETETGDLDLYVFGNPMMFDGATGIIEVTFYAATPEAA